MGALLLVRPVAVYLFAGALVAWWLLAGGRKALAHTALAAATALLIVAPWTARNYAEFGELIPISVQDALVLNGTFNDESASDPVWPYAWRPTTARDGNLFDPAHPLPDDELRTRLTDNARDWIADHPDAVPKSFFWNGVSRLWDVRRPGRALYEVDFDGRTKLVTAVGLGMYYLLLPMAVFALWRMRRSRRALVLPLVAIALTASAVHFAEGRTRYRAPLEPLICVIACSAPLAARSRAAEPVESPVPAPAAA
jgi:hypothetical protein